MEVFTFKNLVNNRERIVLSGVFSIFDLTAQNFVRKLHHSYILKESFFLIVIPYEQNIQGGQHSLSED